MIEAPLKRAINGQRAAEAHAAEHRELAAALQQQADDLQEVLVPTDRDAVLGDTAEAGHDAVAQRFVDLGHVANRLEWNALTGRRHAGHLRRQRFDFQAVDGNHVWPSFIR